MIFRRPEGVFGDTVGGEPFIVPLAIPAIAGPAAIATVMLLASRAPQRLLEWCAAVSVAMLVTAALWFPRTASPNWRANRDCSPSSG